MRHVLIAAALVAVTALSGCATKFRSYHGPEVTRVLVYKESRRMYLLHQDEVLKAYEIELGQAAPRPQDRPRRRAHPRG